MEEVKQTLTPQEWFDKNINIKYLSDAVMRDIKDSVINENVEDDTYIALVHDIVSGSMGRYIPYYALEYFDYEVDVDYIERYDFESIIWELDKFSYELADIINDNLGLDVKVQFGYWDADGTYCLMAYLGKDYVESIEI
jgi:hypothetical protein